MKRIFKVGVTIFAVLTLCFAVMPVTSFAASNTTASFSKDTVKIGDTVTLTVTVSGEALYSTDITGSYNEDVLVYESGASTGGAGMFKIVEGLSGENKKSFTVTFKAAKNGSCTAAVKGVVGDQTAEGSEAQDIELTGANATVNVKEAVTSSSNQNTSNAQSTVSADNANIKSISAKASGQGIKEYNPGTSPRFSPSQTAYTINVKNGVTQCKIYVTTAHPDAKVAITGSSALELGDNVRKLTVTAPSGAQKVYTITVNRSEVADETTASESDSSQTTSSDIESIPALETIIGGVPYMVMKDITGIKIPNGFNVTQRLYNNETVSVAIDDKGNYELYYLKSLDGETAYPYTYDSEKNGFSKVQIINQMDKDYIVAPIPEDCALPDEYMSANVKIGETGINCYSSTDADMNDMYFVYCYYNGEFGMYRYDSLEGVLQRYPELELLEFQSAAAGVDGFANRFMGLSGNAKTIVVCFCIAALGIVALIVLLIVKFVKRSKIEDYDFEYDEDNFETVKIDGDFEIVENQEEE